MIRAPQERLEEALAHGEQERLEHELTEGRRAREQTVQPLRTCAEELVAVALLGVSPGGRVEMRCEVRGQPVDPTRAQEVIDDHSAISFESVEDRCGRLGAREVLKHGPDDTVAPPFAPVDVR
jgi:hypothetical protein